MASNNDFFKMNDTFGRLIKVSRRFGKMREISMKKYDQDRVWIFIPDNSKCFDFETKAFDHTKSNIVGMAYEDLLALKEVIANLEVYNQRMDGEHMMDDGNHAPPAMGQARARPSVRGTKRSNPNSHPSGGAKPAATQGGFHSEHAPQDYDYNY